MPYTPTTWIEGVTTVGPTHLNNIENGLVTADANATAAIPKSVVTTAGDLIYATGNAAVTRLALGAAGTVLKGGASTPSFATIVNADCDAAMALAISKLSGYPSDGTKFLAGDGTWKAAGTPTPVTTLPGSPANNQQTILTDSTSAPTWYWLLQYNSTAAKWQFIGGSSIYAEVQTSETTTSTTYAALTTAGPSITVPNAGDYFVEIGMAASSTGNLSYMSYDIGGTGAVDADAVTEYGQNVTPGYSVSRARKKTGLSASTALTAKYKAITGNTSTFANRWMRVTPIQIS